LLHKDLKEQRGTSALVEASKDLGHIGGYAAETKWLSLACPYHQSLFSPSDWRGFFIFSRL